jgi:hypothetical protein
MGTVKRDQSCPVTNRVAPNNRGKLRMRLCHSLKAEGVDRLVLCQSSAVRAELRSGHSVGSKRARWTHGDGRRRGPIIPAAFAFPQHPKAA